MSLQALHATLARGRSVSPFLVLGDPTLELTLQLAEAAVSAGAGMLEIGFPYSDPVADGPAIQASQQRALEGGASTRSAFRTLARIRDACPDTPLNLLVYGNLVHRWGYEGFAAEAAHCGASSLLVPDIPLEESAPLRRACRQADLGQVQLAGPLTPESRLLRLASASCFLYLAGFQGVTGVRGHGFAAMLHRVQAVAGSVETPICLGFGLSQREQLVRAFEAGARIAVVGSHLARLVERAFRTAGDAADLISRYGAAVRNLAGNE